MEIGFGLGASLGSAIAGIVFDYFQTYRPAFYLTIGLMLASIVGIWIAAPRAARRTVETMASAPAKRPAR
jgi:MFS family permease